jgi:hypothetical protein
LWAELRWPGSIPQELLEKAEYVIVIVTGKRISVPASGRHLVDVLEKSAPHNESKVTSNR